MSKINNANFEEEVYKKYYSLVYSTCIRKLHQKGSIDDAVQSTFLLYIKEQDKIKSNLSSWFYWASKNTCTFMNRVASKNETTSDFDEELVKDEKSENNICLDRLIASLPKKKSELLLMKFFDNLSYQEIAEKTHAKEETVKKTINRTIFLLQSKFKRKDVFITALLAQLFHSSKVSSATIKSSSFILQNSLIQQSIVKGVLNMYLVLKLKSASLVLLVIFGTTGITHSLLKSDEAGNSKINQVKKLKKITTIKSGDYLMDGKTEVNFDRLPMDAVVTSKQKVKLKIEGNVLTLSTTYKGRKKKTIKKMKFNKKLNKYILEENEHGFVLNFSLYVNDSNRIIFSHTMKDKTSDDNTKSVYTLYRNPN